MTGTSEQLLNLTGDQKVVRTFKDEGEGQGCFWRTLPIIEVTMVCQAAEFSGSDQDFGLAATAQTYQSLNSLPVGKLSFSLHCSSSSCLHPTLLCIAVGNEAPLKVEMKSSGYFVVSVSCRMVELP